MVFVHFSRFKPQQPRSISLCGINRYAGSVEMEKIGFINKLKKPQEISGVDKNLAGVLQRTTLLPFLTSTYGRI